MEIDGGEEECLMYPAQTRPGGWEGTAAACATDHSRLLCFHAAVHSICSAKKWNISRWQLLTSSVVREFGDFQIVLEVNFCESTLIIIGGYHKPGISRVLQLQEKCFGVLN